MRSEKPEKIAYIVARRSSSLLQHRDPPEIPLRRCFPQTGFSDRISSSVSLFKIFICLAKLQNLRQDDPVAPSIQLDRKFANR